MIEEAIDSDDDKYEKPLLKSKSSEEILEEIEMEEQEKPRKNTKYKKHTGSSRNVKPQQQPVAGQLKESTSGECSLIIHDHNYHRIYYKIESFLSESIIRSLNT